MQITRETDYAIRCILYLAGKDGNSAVVGEISRDQAVPRTFAAKIMQKLHKAGLVVSTRGVKGGYTLNRTPEEITLLEIVEAIEGPISINICVIDKNSCERQPHCNVHPVWVEIRDLLVEKLRSYTLDKLINNNPPSGDNTTGRRRA
ncbi:MAG: Rrf2 family transcriptional regulator [Nitrospirae bacterium]|nr:Rrf2 family transcriptional regulator [Nitrospirota bacterium]